MPQLAVEQVRMTVLFTNRSEVHIESLSLFNIFLMKHRSKEKSHVHCGPLKKVTIFPKKKLSLLTFLYLLIILLYNGPFIDASDTCLLSPSHCLTLKIYSKSILNVIFSWFSSSLPVLPLIIQINTLMRVFSHKKMDKGQPQGLPVLHPVD